MQAGATPGSRGFLDLFTEHNVCEGLEQSNPGKAELEQPRRNGGEGAPPATFVSRLNSELGLGGDSGHDGGNIRNSKEGPSDAKCSPLSGAMAGLSVCEWLLCLVPLLECPSYSSPMTQSSPPWKAQRCHLLLPPSPPLFSTMRLTACAGLSCLPPLHISLSSNH